jgi:hypothetical protein
MMHVCFERERRPHVLSEDFEEAKRTGYKSGFNEGYKRGYEKGFDEGYEKGRRRNACTPVQFLRIQCECGSMNYHPVFENRLVINEDEERRCCGCGKIISRDDILSCYSRLQSNNRT